MPSVCHVMARLVSRQVSFVVRNAVFAKQPPIFIEERFRAVTFGLALDIFDERVFGMANLEAMCRR